MKHLLNVIEPDFLHDWIDRGERTLSRREGLFVFISTRASTRTRTSVARAAQLLGLSFLEIPWSSFYGSPAIHHGAPRLLRSELKCMSLSSVCAVVIRNDDQNFIEAAAGEGPPLVINGCSERWHPLQSLADLRALRERAGELAGRDIAFVGNGESPVAASLAVAAATIGCRVRVVGPYPPRDSIRRLTSTLGIPIDYASEASAIRGCVAVYADEWFYRALNEAEREEVQPYQVTPEFLAAHAPGALVMHCLPFGEEIAPEVLDMKVSLVWRQAALRAPALAAYVDYAYESQ